MAVNFYKLLTQIVLTTIITQIDVTIHCKPYYGRHDYEDYRKTAYRYPVYFEDNRLYGADYRQDRSLISDFWPRRPYIINYADPSTNSRALRLGFLFKSSDNPKDKSKIKRLEKEEEKIQKKYSKEIMRLEVEIAKKEAELAKLELEIFTKKLASKVDNKQQGRKDADSSHLVVGQGLNLGDNRDESIRDTEVPAEIDS